MECIGTMGKIFGHSYKAVYNSVSKQPDKYSEDISRLLSRCNNDLQVELILDKMKGTTKTCVDIFCRRCGHSIMEKVEDS